MTNGPLLTALVSFSVISFVRTTAIVTDTLFVGRSTIRFATRAIKAVGPWRTGDRRSF